MLKLAGYLNILIAIAHIVGLCWANTMFELTGIGNEMAKIAQIHNSLPYVLTVIVAIAFFVFGLYGLSAGNAFRKLPFVKPVIFLISGIYLFRGLGEIVVDTILGTNSTLETVYSLIALVIGLLFLFGGLRKWKR